GWVEEVIMRQILSWMARSMRIDARIAKAKAAPICAVNVAVCVMKPGPIAEVAMRKMAPTMALRLIFAPSSVRGASDPSEADSDWWSGVGESGACGMEVSDCLCGPGRFRKVSPVRGQLCLCPGTPPRSDKQSNIPCSTKIDLDHTFASLPWGLEVLFGLRGH